MAQQEETIVSGMAGRYATALFALAQDRRTTDQVADELRRFAAMVDDSADLQRFVRSPAIGAEQQLNALSAILARTGIAGITADFLKLVASKRRLFAVRDMIRDFLMLDDRRKGVTRAEVTVAEPLAASHRAALEDALKAVTGGKSVDVSIKVDPAIIGGLTVKLGSRMVDASLKTKLNSIRTLMKEAV